MSTDQVLHNEVVPEQWLNGVPNLVSAGVVIGGWTRQGTGRRRRESSFLRFPGFNI